MAVYRCSRCDEYKDGDWHPATEDPKEEFGLMCEECAGEAEEEEEED